MRNLLVLLILSVVVSYHPAISSLQTNIFTTMPTNSLDWLVKGFYKTPDVLNVNLLGKYINNASIFIVSNAILIIAVVALLFIFKCNCSFLKGTTILIIKGIIIALLGGLAFLAYKYNQNMISDKAHSLASLSTLITSWKSGTGNFIGVSKLPVMLQNINNSIYYNMQYSTYASDDINVRSNCYGSFISSSYSGFK